MYRPIETVFDECSVLNPNETARLLGIHKLTLLRMRQRANCGGLPFVQLSPGRIGYLRSDVRAYLAARRVGALPLEPKAA